MTGTWPQFDATFQSVLGGQDIELLEGRNLAASTLTTGGAAENEVQHLTISSLATSGWFTLTFNGQTSSQLQYNATASSVQMALDFLPTIGMGNVVVTQEPGGPYVITFQGAKGATNVSQLIVNDGNLQGGAIATATNVEGQPQLNEVQQVTVSDAYSGTFTLSFDGQTTGAIAFDAAASAVESALEALTNIDDVSVTGNAGGPYTVTFLAGQAGTTWPSWPATPRTSATS